MKKDWKGIVGIAVTLAAVGPGSLLWLLGKAYVEGAKATVEIGLYLVVALVFAAIAFAFAYFSLNKYSDSLLAKNARLQEELDDCRANATAGGATPRS